MTEKNRKNRRLMVERLAEGDIVTGGSEDEWWRGCMVERMYGGEDERWKGLRGMTLVVRAFKRIRW
jgi:hypothetical protein